MDRNKLLRILQKDLQELNEITDELAGKAQISTNEIEFAAGKSKIVWQEFEYLKELNQQSLHAGNKVSPDVIPLNDKTEGDAGTEAVDEEAANPPAEIQEDRFDNKEEEEEEEEEEVPAAPEEQIGEEIPFTVQLSEDVPPHVIQSQDEENEEETPLPVQQTEETKEEIREETREVDDKRTVSEIFVHEKSVNDLLGTGKTVEHKLTGSPLTKLKIAIGLNDRFLFIRELFNNDARLFNETVDQIDRMENIHEAIALLNANFKWKKNETSLKFAQLVKRRFS